MSEEAVKFVNCVNEIYGVSDSGKIRASHCSLLKLKLPWYLESEAWLGPADEELGSILFASF